MDKHQVKSWTRVALALVLMSCLVGTAVALFLSSLEAVTKLRFECPWLLFLLPLAGAGMARLYQRVGKSTDGGNNLILEEIHDAKFGVPKRMAPMILGATLLTHLFGGSAGREGTALQMGGSLAGTVAQYLGLSREQTRLLLITGMAAGFGAVFGTPIAGAIFATEVLVIGRIHGRALLPSLFAAWLGHGTCLAWGISHSEFSLVAPMEGLMMGGLFHLEFAMMGKVVLAAVGFGGVAVLFTEMIHQTSRGMKRLCPSVSWRAAFGGVSIIALTYALGTSQYLGLGVSSPHPDEVTLMTFFSTNESHPWAWFWKMVFTVLTLGTGYKGGEVTPLFFIGAATGNALAGCLGAPWELLAAMGFVAVFAAASKTPLACSIMAVELFGWTYLPYFMMACYVAFFCSGKFTLYLSQRLHSPGASSLTVREWRESFVKK